MSTSFAPGSVIAGKYEIVRVLGEGGMGIVFEATHLGLGQSVALKTLRADVRADPSLSVRFDREVRASARLRSRHVPRVMDVDVTDDGIPFFVMELLHGRDLAQLVAARGRLPVGEAVDYVLQACAAMREAHEHGIIHRDLKPSNLFLSERSDDGRPVVKVLDFGISKQSRHGSAALTRSGTVVGTMLYAAPEQLRSSATVDERADIWSLGVVLFELLAGRTPFEGDVPQVAAQLVIDDAPLLSVFRPDAPAALVSVLRRTLARAPEDRYETVDRLMIALGPFAPGGPESLGRYGAMASSPSITTNDGYEATLDKPVRAPSNVPTLAATHADAASSEAGRLPRRAAFWVGGLAVAAVLAGFAVVGSQVASREPAPQATPSSRGEAAPSGVVAAPAEVPAVASVAASASASASASADPAPIRTISEKKARPKPSAKPPHAPAGGSSPAITPPVAPLAL